MATSFPGPGTAAGLQFAAVAKSPDMPVVQAMTVLAAASCGSSEKTESVAPASATVSSNPRFMTPRLHCRPTSPAVLVTRCLKRRWAEVRCDYRAGDLLAEIRQPKKSKLY